MEVQFQIDICLNYRLEGITIVNLKMNKQNEKLLLQYLAKDNFSKDEFKKRGLVPSPEEEVIKLNILVKEVLQLLLDLFRKEISEKEKIKVILEKLEIISIDEFDAEEKEMLLDKLRTVFKEVALENIIQKWLRIEIEGVAKDYESIKVTKQRCLKCKANLTTWILESDETLEYPFWEIGKCSECGKLNLISLNKIKSFETKTYEIVRSLKKISHSEDDAKNELEKIEMKKPNK